MKLIDVWINCPDEEVAQKIADALISQRLAACSNIYAPISSRYHWKGDIEFASEVPLLVKSRGDLFDRLCEIVRSLHPDDTPSIVGVPIEYIDEDYARWLMEETEAPSH